MKIKRIKEGKLSKIQPILKFLIPGKTCLAGGALRTLIDSDEEIIDFDLFFINGTESSIIALKTMLLSEGADEIFVCPEGFLHTYKLDGMKIQIITPRIYESAEDIIDSFDLDACRCVYDGEVITTDKMFIKNVMTKQLTVFNVTYPIPTFKRINKYKNKGYKIHNAIVEYTRQLMFETERIVSQQNWDKYQID